MIQFEYRNPATGVYCLFDLDDPEAEGGVELPHGFAYVGLSVAINLLRPRFFGLETMPVVARIAAQCELLVFDPQQPDAFPETPEPSILIERWTRTNERAVRGLAAQQNRPVRQPYLSPKDSIRWWRYSRDRDGFQDQLNAAGEDVFVPSIRLATDSNNRVCRVVQWSWGDNVIPRYFPLVTISCLPGTSTRRTGGRRSFARFDWMRPFDYFQSLSRLTARSRVFESYRQEISRRRRGFFRI